MLNYSTSEGTGKLPDHVQAVVCPVDFSSAAIHAFMLQNVDKYQNFSDALSTLVKGKRVLEIGTGSGILSLLCALHGANRVVAVEREPMSSVAREVFNNIPHGNCKIELIQGDFYRLNLEQEPFDVILSETIGYIGYEEDMALILYTAKQRYAHVGTSIVPSYSQIYVQPLDESIESEGQQPFLTFEHFDTRNLIPKFLPDVFKLGTHPQPNVPIRARWQITKDTAITGVVLYFNCLLGDEIEITNRSNPFWPRCVVPFDHPVFGRFGEDVECEINFERSGVLGYSFMLRAVIGKQPLQNVRFNSNDIQSSEIPSVPVSAKTVVRTVRNLLAKLDSKPESMTRSFQQTE